MIEEHVRRRVTPVVRNVALGVVAHHVDRALQFGVDALVDVGSGVLRLPAETPAGRRALRAELLFAREHEAVHRAVIEVDRLILARVRAALIASEVVRPRREARARIPLAHLTDGWVGQAVGAWKRSEEMVERTVLLHDE